MHVLCFMWVYASLCVCATVCVLCVSMCVYACMCVCVCHNEKKVQAKRQTQQATPAIYSETRFVHTQFSTYTRLKSSLRRLRTSPIGKHGPFFFQIRRTERGTKSGITYPFSLQEHFFCPFFGSYFFLITSMSSNLSVLILISRHVFKFMMPWKVISPYEKRVMNDIQDGEASSVADRSREHVNLVLPARKIAFWIELTLVSTYLFSFPLRVSNNRVSLYFK